MLSHFLALLEIPIALNLDSTVPNSDQLHFFFPMNVLICLFLINYISSSMTLSVYNIVQVDLINVQFLDFAIQMTNRDI